MRAELKALFGIGAVVTTVGLMFWQHSKWTAYQSKDGHFRVEIPGALNEEASSVPADTWLMPMRCVVSEHGEIHYEAGYVEIPADMLRVTSPEALLDCLRWGVAGHGQGALLKDEWIEKDGYSGKEVLARDPQMAVTCLRSYAVADRLYFVMTKAPHHRADSDTIPRFLESFKFTP